jgi:hypothetical protein
MRLSRLRGMQSMQGLPVRRRLWRMRRLWCRLDRSWRTMGRVHRLLRILGPVPLVLGNDAS